jgi:hypothetical protein
MADRIFRPIEPLGTQAIIASSSYIRPLWGVRTGELFTFFTSSTQTTSSKEYYYEVWGSASLSCDEERMFSVAYGNISGSGSVWAGGSDVNRSDTPSTSIYSQYKLMCLDGDEGGLKLSGVNTPMTDFYVISLNRDKFGDKLDPGNFQINLAELDGDSFANDFHTGSNVTVKTGGKIISLIDDSGDGNNILELDTVSSRPRYVVSGTLEDGIYNPSNPHHYGIVFPSQGAIILSAEKLNLSASFNTVTGSNIAGDNSFKLFTAISGAAVSANKGFTARSVQIKNESFYFVRVPYGPMASNNPTWAYPNGSTDSNGNDISGKLINTGWESQPVVYITSVGLYNSSGDLMAVAKLSKPIKKTLNSELTISVTLEY